eukprot:gene21312-28243_t
MAAWWRSLTEGRLAQGLANFNVPRDRKLQESLDFQKLFLCGRLHELTSGGRTKASGGQMQELVREGDSLPTSAQKLYVQNHVRQQIGQMAFSIHNALAQAGDSTAAANLLEEAQQLKHEHRISGKQIRR